MAKKPGSSVTASLEAALKATKPRDLFTALAQAWVSLPAIELAGLAALAAKQAPAMTWEDTDAWLESAASKKAELRPALVASLKGRSVADAGTRFEAVAKWKADPFLANALVELLENPPWTSSGSRPTWTKLFAAVAQQHDARFVALAKTLPAKWGIRDDQKEWLTRAFTRAVAELPAEPPALPPEAKPLVEKLRAKLEQPAQKAAPRAGAKTEAELLAMVYEHPADDGPRLVYADFLTERGDPRGEFISGQLTKPRTKEQLAAEKALLKKHGKAWLGVLAPLLGADFEFRRGFVAKGLVKFKHLQHAQEHATHPEWATLEEAEWSGVGSDNQIAGTRMLAPVFRHLKRASGAWLPGALEAKDVTWALEHLDGFVDDPQVVRQLLESERLPALRSLGVSCSELRADVLTATTRVERFAVLNEPKEPLVAFLVAAERSKLKELGWGPVGFRRGDDGRLSVLGTSDVQQRTSWMGLSLRNTVEAIAGLPDGCIDTIDEALLEQLRENSFLLEAFERLRRKGSAKPPSLAEVAARTLGLKHIVGVSLASSPWVVAGGGDVKFVDPKTSVVTGTVSLVPNGWYSALSRDGRTFATVVEEQELRVFSLPSGALVRTLKVPDSVYSLALSPSGTHAVLTFRKKPAQLLELASGKVTASFEGWSPAFDARGEQLAVSKKSMVSVFTLDGALRTEVAMPELEPRAKCFVTADVVAVNCHFKGVHLLDLTKQEVVKHDETLRADALAADPSGTTILASQGTRAGALLLDGKTLEKRGALPKTEDDSGYVFAPDGRVVCVGKRGVRYAT
ncbi:MAG: TIGR02996 domain-containing protein [Myxococcota bacterium]